MTAARRGLTVDHGRMAGNAIRAVIIGDRRITGIAHARWTRRRRRPSCPRRSPLPAPPPAGPSGVSVLAPGAPDVPRSPAKSPTRCTARTTRQASAATDHGTYAVAGRVEPGAHSRRPASQPALSGGCGQDAFRSVQCLTTTAHPGAKVGICTSRVRPGPRLREWPAERKPGTVVATALPGDKGRQPANGPSGAGRCRRRAGTGVASSSGGPGAEHGASSPGLSRGVRHHGQNTLCITCLSNMSPPLIRRRRAERGAS